MDLEVSVLKLNKPSEEIIIVLKQSIKTTCDYEHGIDGIRPFIYNDKKYYVSLIETTDWEDDGRGKYFYSTMICQLYCKEDNEYFNCFVVQNQTRTGSYYTDWYYTYEDAELKFAQEKIIPEVIVPAHSVVELV